MLNGLITLPWWGYVLVALILTQITIASVTIYLHRHQAHRALHLHPIASHAFRFWLWLATGIVTKEWVAIHRKHHAKVEAEDDPHSPVVKGIRSVLFTGYELYREEAVKQVTLDDYGHETPDDWLENHIYTPHSSMGIALMFLINILLFGPIGITIWAVQMIWIPVFAAGVINGIGHWWGYRNYETADNSMNISPFGLFIGGEELHNNHHAFGSSAKFSNRWWEIDLGWFYIKIMQYMRLARVKKLPPKLIIDKSKNWIDADTVKAVIINRMQIMKDYSDVMSKVYRQEFRNTTAVGKRLMRNGKRFMGRAEIRMDDQARKRLQALLDHNEVLNVVYEHRKKLIAIWSQKAQSHEELLASLQEWCRQAEQTGIKALQEFAANIRTYSLAPQLIY